MLNTILKISLEQIVDPNMFFCAFKITNFMKTGIIMLHELLTVYASSGNDSGVEYLLENGVDAACNNGLAILVAATNGHKRTVALLLCSGAYKHHIEILKLASMISSANGDNYNAEYLAKWADIYASWNQPKE